MNRSAGCVIYELIELKKLFQRKGMFNTRNAILKDEMPALGESHDLEPLLESYTAKFEILMVLAKLKLISFFSIYSI